MKDDDFSVGFPFDNMSKLLGNQDIFDVFYKQAKNAMWSMVQFRELEMAYTCALKEIRTKFEVLNTEFNTQYRRNPISYISTRLKSRDSIMNKLMRNNLPMTIESIEQNLNDVAGIRVVCSYIDDIYKLADSLLKQDDVRLICRKDYIKNPKPNGYRSLHLVIVIPVFFAEKRKELKVEVQIRTIAMDFWASLEHQIKYKQVISEQEKICEELKSCAEVISETDEKMLEIRKRIEAAGDAPTEDEILFEKLRRLNKPIG